MPLNDDDRRIGRSQLAMHFETNDLVAPERLADVIKAVSALARSSEHFGPEARFFVQRVEAGSPTLVVLTFLGAAANFATIATFIGAMRYRIRNSPDHPLPVAVAETMADGVTVFTLAQRAPDGRLLPYPIPQQEVPALARIRARRRALAAHAPGEWLSMEDGTPILTERGERIAVGRGPAVNAPTGAEELVRTSTLETQQAPGAPVLIQGPMVTLAGHFTLAMDGTANFVTDSGGNFRVHNPNQPVHPPVPIGPHMLVDGRLFIGGVGTAPAIHVMSARLFPGPDIVNLPDAP